MCGSPKDKGLLAEDTHDTHTHTHTRRVAGVKTREEREGLQGNKGNSQFSQAYCDSEVFEE